MRNRGGLRAVVLGRQSRRGQGLGGGGRRPLRRTEPGGQLHAGDLVKQIAPLLGGGGGGSPEVAVAGGKDPSGIDRALDEARRLTAGA